MQKKQRDYMCLLYIVYIVYIINIKTYIIDNLTSLSRIPKGNDRYQA